MAAADQQDAPPAPPLDGSEEGDLETMHAPDDAMVANLEGKHVVSPLQGFGPLWQRTYSVRFVGLDKTPVEIMDVWKENFPAFQPPNNRFYPSPRGVKVGEVVFIDSNLAEGPGLRAVTEMASGIMITYVDDVSFTVMTPEGFPVAGWNTFSVRDEDGMVVAQVQGLERTADPVYEFGYRFLGGEAKQDATWMHVLRSLAAHFGVTADVQTRSICVDPNIQWRKALNVRHNAAIRTLLHRITSPLRT